MSREEQRQNRHRRVRGKIFGTKDKPRLSVYRSLKHLNAQLIDDENGSTMASASDLKLAKKGDKKAMALMVGQELAKKAQAVGISEVVFDRGGFKYQGRIAEVARGAREGGLKF